MFTTIVKRRSAVCGLKLEVSRLSAFKLDVSFRLKKKILMCAAILNYTKDGGPSFQTQNVARKDQFSSVPNGLVLKKDFTSHIFT